MVDFILRPEPGVEKKVLDIGQFFAVVPRKPDEQTHNVATFWLAFRVRERYLVGTSSSGILF